VKGFCFEEEEAEESENDILDLTRLDSGSDIVGGE
jgi:hypothetical protein